MVFVWIIVVFVVSCLLFLTDVMLFLFLLLCLLFLTDFMMRFDYVRVSKWYT